MRSFLRRTMIFATCATAGLVWSGCEAKKATEYVTGVSTQMSVPRDLKAISIEVRVGGAVQYCGAYRVYDGKVALPRSLGAYAATEAATTSGPVMVSVVGYTNGDTANDVLIDCASNIGEGDTRILRRSRQPYIPDEIRFLPMPLKYSCYDVKCEGEEDTCKAGKCVPATLTIEQARAQLPLYSPDLVDGTQSNCFSIDQCMGVAAPAIVVEPDTCTYAVANSPGAPSPVSPLVDPFRLPCDNDAECANKSTCEIIDPSLAPPEKKGRCAALPPGTPWEGVNVEVTYDGGINTEVLDLDAEEGFFIVDPTKPQQFRLAPGLCEMVKGGVGPDGKPIAKHRITAVRASGTCQPKRLAQPICAADQLKQMDLDGNGIATASAPPNDCSTVEIKPPQSALLLVVDNTDGHAGFFNDQELLKSVDLPLQDPAFAQTFIGLQYSPGADACGGSTPPAVALEPAQAVRQKIIDELIATGGKLVPGGTPHFEGALASAYKTLGALDDSYYRRAVIVIGNRDFNKDECPDPLTTPAAEASAAHPDGSPKPIRTYVIQLAKIPGQPVDGPLDDGLLPLVAAGAMPGDKGYDPNARGNRRNAKLAFQEVINTLATCVYDAPSETVPAAADTLSFNDPLLGVTTKILPNANCNKEGVDGEGWGSGVVNGKKRIFLCNASCTTYRNVLGAASDFSLLYQKPPFAVPIFSHKASCEPK